MLGIRVGNFIFFSGKMLGIRATSLEEKGNKPTNFDIQFVLDMVNIQQNLGNIPNFVTLPAFVSFQNFNLQILRDPFDSLAIVSKCVENWPGQREVRPKETSC